MIQSVSCARIPLFSVCFAVACFFLLTRGAQAQRSNNTSQDVEKVTAQAMETPAAPLSTIGRPFYSAVQEWKKDISDRYGIDLALQNTTIWQTAGGSTDPSNAMENTLGLFGTWKIFRS